MVRFFSQILVIMCFLVPATAFCGSFELRFSTVIENEANDIFPDSFVAFGRSDILPNGLISDPLFQPPGPPVGSYVQISKLDLPYNFHRDSIVYDPNGAEILYSMTLNAFDEQSIGLSGNCVIQLENPEALQNLPADCLVYVRRFDKLGNFIASYDLSDPDDHTFQWPVSEVSGLFGQLDFLIVDRCMAADLMIDDRINLEDYAILAADWNQTGSTVVGDIFLDEKVDLKDLSILAEKWLCSCAE